mmetsp:Transcript_25443/g.35687  ORF Transcript_25443/g.35687 Transcript_25443/m.35687 type:complete len:538 (-) Transcript_25443:1469-3082(-)
MDKETKSSGKEHAKISEDSFGNKKSQKSFFLSGKQARTKRKNHESVTEPTAKRLSKEHKEDLNSIVLLSNGAYAVPPSDGELVYLQMAPKIPSDPTKAKAEVRKEPLLVPGSNMELDKRKGNNTVNTFLYNNNSTQSIEDLLDDVELGESGDQDQNSQDDMEGSQILDQSSDKGSWLYDQLPDMEVDLRSSSSFIHKPPCTANEIQKPKQCETSRTTGLLSSQEIFDEPKSPAISLHAKDVHSPASSKSTHIRIGGLEACIIEMQENEIDDFAELNVMKWMSKRQEQYQPKPHYLSWQPHMNANMRAVLLDWMAEVCEEYHVHRETYHISVNYVDRFLTKCHSVPRDKLQLLGIVALFVASKFEETYALQPKDLSNVTAGTYTVEQILLMENILVTQLQWKLLPPTPYSWLRMYVCKRLQSYSEDTRDQFPKNDFLKMIQYIDYATLDLASMEFPASVLAASVFHMFYTNDASVTASVTGYNVTTLEKCMDFMKSFASLPMPKQARMPAEFWQSEYHEFQLKVDGVLDQVKNKIRVN